MPGDEPVRRAGAEGVDRRSHQHRRNELPPNADQGGQRRIGAQQQHGRGQEASGKEARVGREQQHYQVVVFPPVFLPPVLRARVPTLDDSRRRKVEELF